MSGTGQLQFVTAAREDAERVSALVNSAYRGEGSKRGWTTEAYFLGGQRTDPEQIAAIIAAPTSRIELAIQDGEFVGCVHLRREPPSTCYLGMLTVDPGRQTKGLGSRLLEHSEKVARAWECRTIRMTVVHVRVELVSYYERRGYLRTGVTLPFPSDDPRFGIPQMPLHFLELTKPI